MDPNLAHCEHAFEAFQTKSGQKTIKADDLGLLLHGLEFNVTAAQLQQLKQDYESSGLITYENFMKIVSEIGHGEGHKPSKHFDDVVAVFNMFDRDRDGYIGLTEMKRLLRSLGVDLSEKDFEMMFSVADVDKDGAISLSDYAALVGLVEDMPAVARDKGASASSTQGVTKRAGGDGKEEAGERSTATSSTKVGFAESAEAVPQDPARDSPVWAV